MSGFNVSSLKSGRTLLTHLLYPSPPPPPAPVWPLQVRKAANTLNNVLARRHEGCDLDGLNLMGGAERRISNALCHGARGLVFVTVAKV